MTSPSHSSAPTSTEDRHAQTPVGGTRITRFPLTDLPIWLSLLLVALGLPRTVLADLDIVPPESGALYYTLALIPFAVWLGVALTRRSRRPFLDFVVVGFLYGVSLVVVHQALWNVGPGLGHSTPASAIEFADRFAPAWREAALRVYTSGVAMVIGLGSGAAIGLVSLGATRWRTRTSRRSNRGR
jgi:hypothetical protein